MGDRVLQQKILDAFQILTDKAVKSAQFDRTIRATVSSCEDRTLGKYKCRYQDAAIVAYSSSADTIYNNNTEVYILIPNGDMSNRKTIIGSVKTLGTDYVSAATGDDAYEINGTNVLSAGRESVYCLNSGYKKYEFPIYKVGLVESLVAVDKVAIENYIKKSKSLIVGAKIKTNIPASRQTRGHYGIKFMLQFLDNTSNKSVLRPYIIDEDSMIDNPYKLEYKTRQYKIFDIDGQNFERLDSITIFSQDFPNPLPDEDQIDGSKSEDFIRVTEEHDIEISDLQLCGATRFSQMELEGVMISLSTPYGDYFTSDDRGTAAKPVTAQVRIKGKLADAVGQSIPFYWGREDLTVNTGSSYYNEQLGRGWHCYNRSVITQQQTEDEPAVVSWTPYDKTFEITKSMVPAKQTRFKVAIVYDNKVYSKQFIIQNLSSHIHEIKITSDGGTKFYYDIGHPTLTCEVVNPDGTQEEDENSKYIFYWARVSDTGTYTILEQTTEENKAYDNLIKDYNWLLNQIKVGARIKEQWQTNIDNFQKDIKEFNNVQRVLLNQIINLQVNTITNFAVYKCAVYRKSDSAYMGTASITISNSFNTEDTYSLVINEGAVTFKYNENGIAPNNGSLVVPQVIKALSFSIYNNLGEKIEDDITANANNCKITWKIPIKNTLLVDKNTAQGQLSEDGNYKLYTNNLTNFSYDIAQKYDVSKQNNQIELTVDYKDMNLTASTNFTFAKEGEPGTNGTEYLVRLIPFTNPLDQVPLFPMITVINDNGTRKFALNYRLRKGFKNSQRAGIVISQDFDNESYISKDESYQLFKAQLWKNGELIWQGISLQDYSVNNTNGAIKSINWSIARGKRYDTSAFEISEKYGQVSLNKKILDVTNPLSNIVNQPLADIVKCEIIYNDGGGEDKSYYGTIPVTVAYVENNIYRVSLKDFTGFRYVLYTSDGMSPQYDSANPFEFIINKYESTPQIWTDISEVEGNNKMSYYSDAVGRRPLDSLRALDTSDAGLSNELTRTAANNNKFSYVPAQRSNGECFNNAVYCVFRFANDQTKKIIARIHVPIHFLLNKYGLAHLNGWDGNTIDINNDGGYILAPQMGAGKKEEDNSFTGVLMGQVREPNKKQKIGLLGYAKGIRSFFLNSENGSAIFGKEGAGQIIIDPSTNNALLYSNGFWKNYQDNGLPSNYNYSFNANATDKRNMFTVGSGNTNSKGMLIDLSTPRIIFGNGNFVVSQLGHLVAKGGGSIAGWHFDDDRLWAYKKNSNGNEDVTQSIGLNSKDINNGDAKAFWIGGRADDSNMTSLSSGSYITFGGHLHFGDNESFFDFNPNDGVGAALSIQNWHITNNSQESRSSLFYGLWGNSVVGMSGNPKDNQDYLWAGWKGDTSYALVVEADGDVAICQNNGGNLILPYPERIKIGSESGPSLYEYINSLIPDEPEDESEEDTETEEQ